MNKLKMFSDNTDNKAIDNADCENVTLVNFKKNNKIIRFEDVKGYLCDRLRSKQAYLSWYSDESLSLFESALEDNIKLKRVLPHYTAYDVLEELVEVGGEKYELGLYYSLVSPDVEDSLIVYSAKEIAKMKYFKPIGYSLDRKEIDRLTKNYMKPDKDIDIFLSKRPMLSIQLSDGYSIDYYREEELFVESRRRVYKDLMTLARKSPRGVTNTIATLLLALSNNDLTKKCKIKHLKMTPEKFAQKYYDEFLARKSIDDSSKILDRFVTEVPLVLVCKDIEDILKAIDEKELIELYETSVKDIVERYGLLTYFKSEDTNPEVISKVLLDIAERVVGRKIPTKETCFKLIDKYTKQRNKSL